MAIWRIGPNDWPNLSTVLAQGAQAWDTVLIMQAGSPYPNAVWDVYFPFPLHVFGEPGGTPVEVPVIRIDLLDTPAPAGDWWVENLFIRRTGSGSGLVQIYSGAHWSGMRLVVHQCEDRRDLSDGIVNGSDVYGQGRRMLFSRVVCLGARSTGQLINLAADDQIELDRVELNYPIGSYSGASAEDVVVSSDYVTAPTDGYGPDYSYFLNPAIAAHGGAGRIFGSVYLREGESPDGTVLHLYRETENGTIEARRWIETTPDPVTGDYEFRYLPTDHRYWVQCIPPSGYEPVIRGPYIPQII